MFLKTYNNLCLNELNKNDVFDKYQKYILEL